MKLSSPLRDSAAVALTERARQSRAISEIQGGGDTREAATSSGRPALAWSGSGPPIRQVKGQAAAVIKRFFRRRKKLLNAAVDHIGLIQRSR